MADHGFKQAAKLLEVLDDEYSFHMLLPVFDMPVLKDLEARTRGRYGTDSPMPVSIAGLLGLTNEEAEAAIEEERAHQSRNQTISCGTSGGFAC